jgi:hypothetical protein
MQAAAPTTPILLAGRTHTPHLPHPPLGPGVPRLQDGVNKWGSMAVELLFFAAFFCLAWLTLSVKRYRK